MSEPRIQYEISILQVVITPLEEPGKYPQRDTTNIYSQVLETIDMPGLVRFLNQKPPKAEKS